MVDETDISQEWKWFYRERIKAVVSNLRKRNISAQHVLSRQEALSVAMEMIPERVTVSRGDSVTLEQIGIIDELRKSKKHRFIDPFARTDDGFFVLDPQARLNMQREALLADVFLTSVNAVTLDGKLVSIDALGNRVGAMVFGPAKVIVIVGANKIVKDEAEALERIRQVAAPLNVQRHYLKHHIPEFADLPCARTGRCANCNHEWRICNVTVIIEGTFVPVRERMNVVLVEEELGL